MMSSKGIKRKLSDREDFGGDPVAHSYDVNGNLRQSLLNMSLDKFNTGRMMVEPSLRRSVLIANTLRVLQEEMRIENSRAPPVADLTAAASLCAQTSAYSAEVPSLVPLHTHSHGIAEDLDSMFFSEDDFSLTSAISAILKDLEMVLEDGAPSQNHPRFCLNHDVERKQDVSPSKYSSQNPLPCVSYCDENRVGELKRVLSFDSCNSQAASPELVDAVEDMDIELVGELILGAEFCQQNPLNIAESQNLPPKPDFIQLDFLPKDQSNRLSETKPLDSVFGNFELMSSSYLKDLPLDDLFLDIDTSVFERETAFAQGPSTSGRTPLYPADDLPAFASSCNSASYASSQPSRDLNELDNIMEILVGS